MKTLLTIHDADREVDTLDPMIKLSQEIGAHLNIVVLGLIHSVPVTAAPGVPAYYFSESNSDLIEACKDRVSEIEKYVQNEGSSASVSLECRDPALVEKTILGHAIFADVAVFANKSVLGIHSHERAFNGSVLNSGRPALIMGADTKVSTFKKAMFAWNGTPEAAKAMHHSLSWLGSGAEVNVVIVDPDEYKTGPNPGDDIAAFLARRNLKVTVDRLPGGQHDASEVLLEHATDIDADLLVMGAYGRSRFSEWLLGGTTSAILEKAKLPVLLAH